MSKPKLLYITPTVPKPSGNGLSMRAYNVLRALSSKYSIYLLIVPTCEEPPLSLAVAESCQGVACLPLGLGMDFSLTARLLAQKIAPRLFSRCSSHPMEWLYITPKRLKSVARMFRGVQFDIIHVFRLYMAPYALPFRGDDFSGVCQLDLDDIESLTRRRLAELYALNGDARMASCMKAETKKYEALERNLLPRFDRIFVCSSPDKDRLARQHKGVKFETIPNVVRIPGETIENPRGTFTILFVGSLGYYPNSEGIIFFCERVLPVLRRKSDAAFSVKVVGDGISPKIARRLSSIPELSLVGCVPNVGTYYRNAHMVIVPIRAGGGTRIKALEAFAYRRPVVSTTIGVEGIDVQHEQHALIADTEEMFAENCFRIMTDRALRGRLVDNAFHLVTEFHNMELLKDHEPIFLESRERF